MLYSAHQGQIKKNIFQSQILSSMTAKVQGDVHERQVHCLDQFTVNVHIFDQQLDALMQGEKNENKYIQTEK